MKGMEDVPLVKKRILFSAGFSNIILDNSECLIFEISHLPHWREQVNAPIDARDIDLVQQTFARVAMLGSNAIGRLLFMNIFKRLGDQTCHFQRENPRNARDPQSWNTVPVSSNMAKSSNSSMRFSQRTTPPLTPWIAQLVMFDYPIMFPFDSIQFH